MDIRLKPFLQLAILFDTWKTVFGLGAQRIINYINAIDDLLNENLDIQSSDRALIILRFKQLSARLLGDVEISGGDRNVDVLPTDRLSGMVGEVNHATKRLDLLMRAFQTEKMYNARSRRDINSLKTELAERKGESHLLSEIMLNGFRQIEKYHVHQNTSQQYLASLLQQASEDLTNVVTGIQLIEERVEHIYNTTVGADHIKNKTSVPRSCRDIKNGKSGVYTVYPDFQLSGVDVYCNMEIDGGGWIVFQRRHDGFVDFFRNWNDYKNGFGDLNWEFWLGNDNIYGFTNERSSEMRIDLVDENGNRGYAKYDLFKVDSEENKYELTVWDYSGNVGDAFETHNHMMFSTKDMDNDKHGSRNCADYYTGAWWYNACHNSNLNGDYHVRSTKGPRWYKWHGDDTRMTFQEMKLRWKY